MQTDFLSLPLKVQLNDKESIIVDFIDDTYLYYHTPVDTGRVVAVNHNYYIHYRDYTITILAVSGYIISYNVEVPIPDRTYLLLQNLLTKEIKL